MAERRRPVRGVTRGVGQHVNKEHWFAIEPNLIGNQPDAVAVINPGRSMAKIERLNGRAVCPMPAVNGNLVCRGGKPGGDDDILFVACDQCAERVRFQDFHALGTDDVVVL